MTTAPAATTSDLPSDGSGSRSLGDRLSGHGWWTAIWFGIGALLFLHRMAQSVNVEQPQPMIAPDEADEANGRTRYDPALATDPDVVIYRISGAFFFGAAASVVGWGLFALASAVDVASTGDCVSSVGGVTTWADAADAKPISPTR